MAKAAITISSSLSAATKLSLPKRSVLSKTLASFSSSSSARKLILYSKPGCCLCDGLKEKLLTAFSLSSPEPLHDVHLLILKSHSFRRKTIIERRREYNFVQVRDITTNPEWERAYQYEIPVLARLLPDGTEELLPRLSPRLGVELVQKKIATALRE